MMKRFLEYFIAIVGTISVASLVSKFLVEGTTSGDQIARALVASSLIEQQVEEQNYPNHDHFSTTQGGNHLVEGFRNLRRSRGDRNRGDRRRYDPQEEFLTVSGNANDAQDDEPQQHGITELHRAGDVASLQVPGDDSETEQPHGITELHRAGDVASLEVPEDDNEKKHQHGDRSRGDRKPFDPQGVLKDVDEQDEETKQKLDITEIRGAGGIASLQAPDDDSEKKHGDRNRGERKQFDPQGVLKVSNKDVDEQDDETKHGITELHRAGDVASVEVPDYDSEKQQPGFTELNKVGDFPAIEVPDDIFNEFDFRSDPNNSPTSDEFPHEVLVVGTIVKIKDPLST